MEPLVSVIVPVYNNERYFRKCLSSIAGQTYRNMQIIVVNDGSTDRSREIMERFIALDGRFLCLDQANMGVAAARNTALAHAIGEYYLFVDADDYLGKTYVAKLVQCAKENESELVIGGYTLVYPGKGKKIRIVPTGYIPQRQEEWAYRISAVCGRLYKASFWKVGHQMEFADEPGARAEDVPIAMYANAMACNICTVPSAGYYYVQHPGSAMHQKRGKVPFCFPYSSFGRMYKQLGNRALTNSRVYFDIGVIKFLAQFEFGIYRNAGKEEKQKFREYVHRLLWKDWERIVREWKQNRAGIRFPLLHKIAIELFILKYGWIMHGPQKGRYFRSDIRGGI